MNNNYNKTPREPQSVEKSMGYISWSLKEISENLRKLLEFLAGNAPKPENSSDLPF